MKLGEGVEYKLSLRADATAEESASAFIAERLGLKADAFKVKSTGEGEFAKMAYIKQQHVSLDICSCRAAG